MHEDKKRLSPDFAVFNYHVNDAKSKARAIYIANFGEDSWSTYIQPFEDAGIMSVFHGIPTPQAMFWVTAVTMIANGDVDAVPDGGYEAFSVEVQRTLVTTVKVRAKNAPSAALIADDADFELPGLDDWTQLPDSYVVRNTAGEDLYEGTSGDLS